MARPGQQCDCESDYRGKLFPFMSPKARRPQNEPIIQFPTFKQCYDIRKAVRGPSSSMAFTTHDAHIDDALFRSKNQASLFLHSSPSAQERPSMANLRTTRSAMGPLSRHVRRCGKARMYWERSVPWSPTSGHSNKYFQNIHADLPIPNAKFDLYALSLRECRTSIRSPFLRREGRKLYKYRRRVCRIRMARSCTLVCVDNPIHRYVVTHRAKPLQRATRKN